MYSYILKFDVFDLLQNLTDTAMYGLGGRTGFMPA